LLTAKIEKLWKFKAGYACFAVC